jgi:hypothetical protein
MLIDTTNSPHAKVCPIPQQNITWLPGLWNDVFNRTGTVTIPHILSHFEDKSTFHAFENFRIAAGETDGKFKGNPYGDGDVYKLLEGLMYYVVRTNDLKSEQLLENYIQLIAKAQQPDGYLSTKQIIGERQNTGAKRLGDIEDFEVYNFGHMFTAACTYKRLFNKDSFLNIAIKAADYLEQVYRKAALTGEVQTAVCPSHYMGLVELYRTTKDRRYLDLAELAINLRDKIKNGTDDNQDRFPLRDHAKIVGHAVRSTYLYAGCADIYAETGEAALLDMLHKVWQNLTEKKLYITGGCGALYNGVSPYGIFPTDQKTHQAFGYEYQLPNVTAYNETCGTLGNIFWTYRMFASSPEAKYFDLIERSFLNLTLASVSLSGDKYFYENMLRRAKKLDYDLRWPLERAHFIECFCCPANVARCMVQVMEYLYTTSVNAVYIGIYGASETKFELKNGSKFTIRQETNYPWSGTIKLTVDMESSADFTLNIRIPEWAEAGYISTPEMRDAITPTNSSSYYPLQINKSQVVEIHFEMPVRLTTAHSLVEENVNQAAVERGPLVYCIETPDAEIDTLDDLLIPTNASFNPINYLIGETDVIALETEAVTLNQCIQPNKLYNTLKITGFNKVKIRMVPYFAWDNRGYGEMRIWMPLFYDGKR